MTLKSFLLILRRQFLQKWGRFLLASGGIMIGVWAITLTSSLSLGLSDTIVTAINSQAAAKEIRLYKLEGEKTSFFELQGPPSFIPLSKTQLNELAQKNPNIVGIAPSEILNVYVHTSSSDVATRCVDNRPDFNLAMARESGQIAIQAPTDSSAPENSNADNPSTTSSVPQASVSAPATINPAPVSTKKDISTICQSLTVLSNVFENFYENHKKDWLGQTNAPARGEIVACFKCGEVELGKKLGASSPQDLIGKSITIELDQAPDAQKTGAIVNAASYNRKPKLLPTSELVTLKIVSVVDDRDSANFSFTGGASNNLFLDFSYFEDAIKKTSPELSLDEVGYVENVVYIDSYKSLNKVIDDLKNQKYAPFSLIQAVVTGIESVFKVLTIVLACFGLIAMVASVFGIINVMTISVLERKKEIGILKSLGARDGDIFKIFLIESTSLGFLGWLMGTLIAILMGLLIGFIFKLVINSNPNLMNSLESLNINEFSPSFPWWLLAATLALSLFFTILSGVFPAIKAAKQNPTDVLRGE